MKSLLGYLLIVMAVSAWLGLNFNCYHDDVHRWDFVLAAVVWWSTIILQWELQGRVTMVLQPRAWN